jgi:hypothetical protein
MTAALQGTMPDCVPAAPSYLGLFRADVEKEYYVRQYRERMKGTSRYQPDHDEDVEFRAKAVHHAHEFFKEMPDCIEVTPGPARDWASRTEIVSENSRLWYLDTVTGDRYDMLDAPFPSGRDYLYGNIPSSEQDVWDRSELIQNRDVIDMLVRIVPLEELEEQGVFDLPRKVICDTGETFYVVVIDSTPYCAAYLLGFQGMMLAFHDNPDNLKYYMHRILQQREPILRGYARSGYNGIYAEEIFSGVDIISPDLFDEFVFPFNAEYFRITRELGLLTTYYVCGNPVPLIPRIMQMECDAVAFEESKKNFEIAIDEIVEAAGKEKCIFGNIDAAYYGLQAGVDEITAEVHRQIEAGLKAKGFVVSTGSPLPLESPLRNIDAMVAAAHSHPLC